MAQKHRLAAQRRLHAADFEGETLITYPGAGTAHRPDPRSAEAGRHTFQRRTAELTVAVLQLVASRRGIAACRTGPSRIMSITTM
jgi:LysR family transcriptional regulator for metE and metH